MNIGTVTVTMNNWIVESDHSILLGTSGENAVARLDIITTVDDGWIYMLEIEHLDRGEKNIIPLTAETNKVYAVLTSEMLGNRGGKKLQIRAINGEQVKKSNVFRGYVNNSVNASENIPEHTQTVIDEAVERVDELATNAQSSAAAAETSATNAQSSAAAAETSATNAGNSAAAAETSATNAGNSAAAAETSATNAGNSAAAAERAAQEAAISESNSKNKAEDAETYALNAQNAYNQANAAKEAAADSAEQAAGSEGNALTYMTRAETAATGAAESETNAAESEANAKLYSEQAAAVFALAGDVSFAIGADKGVTMIFTTN